MEETKKKAVERMRDQMNQDYQKGYKRACEMLANGKMTLQEAQQLVNTEDPRHEEFIEKSEDFVKGFIAGLDEVLDEAKRERDQK